MNFDRTIVEFDRVLRTLLGPAQSSRRLTLEPEAPLSEAERQHAAALMRVNHAGEICAQALYQGQSLTSSEPRIAQVLRKAAEEEEEHLAWTERRIAELGGRRSFLNPLWYAGAFALGAVAGRLGTAWNLGFLSETERQVESHLSSHLERLPANDTRSRQILSQMHDDEARHGQTARDLGGRELPPLVRGAMRAASRVMTRTAYWV